MMTAANGIAGKQMGLLLKYTGPTVDTGRMGVYDVAANMMTFSDYVIVAAKTIYGQEIRVTAEVSAFKKGSFETDLLFHVAGVASSLFAANPDIAAICSTVKESIDLFRFLKGEPPKEVTRVDRSVHVENNNGQLTIVNIDSLTLAMNPRAGEAAAQFIGRALDTVGVEGVTIGLPGKEMIAVDESEADYFRPLSADTNESEQIIPDMKLQLAAAGFKDGLKWKFSDGTRSITAQVKDLNFLERVEAGEPFRKGDVLVCDVRLIQSVTATSKLRTKHEIIVVKKHFSSVKVETAALTFPPSQ